MLSKHFVGINSWINNRSHGFSIWIPNENVTMDVPSSIMKFIACVEAINNSPN